MKHLMGVSFGGVQYFHGSEWLYVKNVVGRVEQGTKLTINRFEVYFSI